MGYENINLVKLNWWWNINRLKDLREDNDLFWKDIAEILNISQAGYFKYETETNDIPTSILIKLSLYYETSIDYILGLTNGKSFI